MRKTVALSIAFAMLLGMAGPSFAMTARGHEATTLTQINGATGNGTAVLTTTPSKRKICFDVNYTVASATTYTATIYQTAVSGPVATLFSGASGPESTGCVTPKTAGAAGVFVGRNKLKKLVRHPSSFDLKVSTDNFPSGALDGALHRGTTP